MQARKAKKKEVEPVRLLVTNIDNCALELFGTEPNLISKPIIAYAKKGKFDGFYAISGRRYMMNPEYEMNFLEYLTHYAVKKTNQTEYTTATIANNYTTTAFTVNFAKATGLPLKAVSTVEDLILDRKCGDGFEQVIKPYETKAKKPKLTLCATQDKIGRYDTSKSKDKQIRQIAAHAKAEHKDAPVHLVLIEDNAKCAEAAAEMKLKGVQLSVLLKKAQYDKPTKGKTKKILGDKAKLECLTDDIVMEMKEEVLAETSDHEDVAKMEDEVEMKAEVSPAAESDHENEADMEDGAEMADDEVEMKEEAAPAPKKKAPLQMHGMFGRATRSQTKAAAESMMRLGHR